MAFLLSLRFLRLLAVLSGCSVPLLLIGILFLLVLFLLLVLVVFVLLLLVLVLVILVFVILFIFLLIVLLRLLLFELLQFFADEILVELSCFVGGANTQGRFVMLEGLLPESDPFLGIG